MRIIKFEVLRGIELQGTLNKNILIFLNLENELRIVHEVYESVLKPNDIFLLNEKSHYSLYGPDALFVRFEIDTAAFRTLFSQKRYHFLCDSSKEFNDNFILLRRQLTDILRVYYEHQEYREAALAQHSYALLIFLVSNFAAGEFVAKEGTEAEQLLDYIDHNYQEELTLNRISADFHMTPQYFSKYFKANVGTTYYRYLSAIRLEHATEALLQSNSNLLHVALDSGFPNAESFYRYFQEAYEMTPQEYRKKHMRFQEKEEKEQRLALKDALMHLGGIRQNADAETNEFVIDVSKKEKFIPFWREIINLNNPMILHNVEVQEQLRQIQRELRYRYARLPLDFGLYTNEGYSFYEEEQNLDLLIDMGLRIWFYVDVQLVTDQDVVCGYLDKLLSHMANRYSIGNIRQWRFELIYSTAFEEKRVDFYWTLFGRMERIIEKYGCKERLAGAGISLGNIQGIVCFYEYMKKRGISLDTHILQAEPYTLYDIGKGTAFTRATDSSYIKNRLMSFRRNIEGFESDPEKIYITSWSDNLLNHNLLNDSCYRGAEIIKNVIDCFGSVRALTHKMPLDIMDKSGLHGKILFGADGMISKHGIKKPSFYSYGFLNHTGDHYFAKDDHSVIFGNDVNYQIICHNCKRLSYQYYLEEENLKLDKLDYYFDDLEPLRLDFCLRNIKNGRYVIKIRMVSQEHGSVQDKLRNMVSESNIYIHSNDLGYLRQICVPQIRLQNLNVTDETARIELELPANAFAHIHIIYQY